MFRSAADPEELYEVVYFESEEKARANGRKPSHRELLGQMIESSLMVSRSTWT